MWKYVETKPTFTRVCVCVCATVCSGDSDEKYSKGLKQLIKYQ